MNYMDFVIETVQEAAQKLWQIEVEPSLDYPKPQFGDVATNVAFGLAKQLKQAPLKIAEELASELNLLDFLEANVAAPGFINLKVDDNWLASKFAENFGPGFGGNQKNLGKTAIVEYPSQNMAKPYSVGHLRPGNQGWAAYKLLEATGWRVITDNHLGDYGSPFGIWVAGFLRFSSPEKLTKDGVYELGRVYIQTREVMKQEEADEKNDLAKEVEEWLLKLEAGDEEALRYSRQFNQISLEHIHQVMHRLRIYTDYELGEAFFAPIGKNLVQKLLEQKIATQNDDGSVVVDLTDQGVKVPVLLQKSNGAALYATTDLATVWYREQRWQPDKVVYAVGGEQQFHFQQIFALARKTGHTKTDFIHMWFGTIDQVDQDGKRQKMSSRQGVILMEELLDQAEARARELVGDRKISQQDIATIALGAIKFSDFMADRRTNILFDWQTIFALNGFSGPAVQYAAVRIKKILDKVGFATGQTWSVDQTSTEDFSAEKPLLVKLTQYPNVINESAELLEPHRLASYLYELARATNRYYESEPILAENVTSQDRERRLAMLAQVYQVLEDGLEILGIQIPNQM